MRTATIPIALSCLLSAAATSAQQPADSTSMRIRPNVLPYQPGEPIPPGYRRVERYQPRWMATGPLLLGAAYIPSLALGIRGWDQPIARWLMIPGAGPYLSIGAWYRGRDYKSSCVGSQRDDDVGCPLEVIIVGVFAVDALVQGAGIALLTTGLVWKETVLVWDDQARPRITSVRPVAFGGSGLGVVASGLF